MPESVRVYVPATLVALSELNSSGRLEVGQATAVTPGLRAALPGLDEEELELEAFLDAAELSLALVHGGDGTPPRRVVVSSDVPRSAVAPDPDAGLAAVRLGGPLAFDQVAAIHVDEAPAEALVAAGTVEDVDLLWYAPQEIGDIVGE